MRRQGYKFELMPNGEQTRQMVSFAGSCRFVYNKALALQEESRRNGDKRLSYAGLSKLITVWRNNPETGWLADAPRHSLDQSVKDLERAYSNFFARRALVPRFKKKGQHDSFRESDPKNFKIDQSNSRICLPKLGWLRYRKSREVLGTAKNVTVSLSGGRWFISVQTEREVELAAHPASSSVGIDVGVARFATLSDGTHVEALSSFRKHELRLARYQRRMSRKKKFSNNWKKAKAKVQRIHSHITNARRDFLHKTTTTISKNHALVIVEDLQVGKMSKSAAGTIENPARMVRPKSGLNKSILDQGWREFRRQLEYKLGWLGGQLLAVPPHNTSRTCPSCDHVSKDNRKKQAQFICVECGFAENADLVGALNVLARGHRALACGETPEVRDSVKQEPTEASLCAI